MHWPHLCQPTLHLSRRTLLGAGGGTMLSLLARRLHAAHAAGQNDPARPRSVILLWLEGGPSQLETFDPHPGGRIGGETRAIPTSVPDLQIAHLLPQTAAQMHLASLVRSVTGKEGDHERAVYNLKTGYRPDPTLTHPAIGAIVCHADPRGADIPRHVSIVPGAWPARGGYLGAKYDAFKVADPAGPIPNVEPAVAPDRYRRRIEDLYEVLETEFRRDRLASLELNRTLHQTATAAALEMMSSAQLEAFSVDQEPAAERQAFGDNPFGRGCLAAARLIEVGVRCVEVTLTGWDSHVANHSLQSAACEQLDPALAALLTRLQQRELLDSTLVVCGGEFGRTPRINPADGRDHWPHGFSTLLAGCQIRRGGVHGATDADPPDDHPDPAQRVHDAVTVADLHATILAGLGIDPQEELETPVGRPMKRSDGQVIRSLLA